MDIENKKIGGQQILISVIGLIGLIMKYFIFFALKACYHLNLVT